MAYCHTNTTGLPRFLWNSIRTYLSYVDILKLNQADIQFKYIFNEADWKGIFGTRPSDIAVVKTNTNNNHFWYDACITHTGCNTIKEAMDIIKCERNNWPIINWFTVYDYRIYFQSGIFNWNSNEIYFNDNYKIELIGAHDGQTIFRSTDLAYLRITVGHSLMLSHIQFSNIVVDLCNNHVCRRSKVINISNCIFDQSSLQYDQVENTPCAITIDNTVFRNNIWCIQLLFCQKSTTIYITNSKFDHCDVIFRNFYVPKTDTKAIVFKGNYVSHIKNCGLDEMPVDLSANIFSNVSNLYKYGDKSNISNITFDDTNTFENCDMIIPCVSKVSQYNRCKCVLC